ncbi:PAS domain S-box protein [Dactylosporangium sp. AC04546]|uniref:PAS domain-containing hybrid sensor histidine kinase/response regulator n=1 Tax=Dactylosporangium sp. AC04546 TaxID=2862460 RepID=UPI001EE01BF8|nr:PAS domain S-box protein [Dactylosporangium sp. AC04546]WVK86166.1 PAS domain S-box protein [Dactylosporangium sp. AC04546]
MQWTERLAHDLLEVSPEAIVVTREDGRIMLANAAARRLFDRETGAFVGEVADVLVPPELRPLTPRVLAYLAGQHPQQRTGQPLSMIHRDGSQFQADVSLSIVHADDGQYLVATIRDANATGADPAQVMLASIVQSSHDAIVTTDLDGMVLSWNPGAERLYGLSAGEMIGRSKDRIIPPDRRPDEAEIREIVAAGGRIDPYHTRRLRRDGEVFTVSMLVSPLTSPEGTTVGVTTITRDISERERAEAKMQAVLDAAPDPLLGFDEADRVVLANTQAERLFGLPRRDLVDLPVEHLLPGGPRGAPVPDAPFGWDGPVALRRDGSLVPVDIALSTARTEDGPITLAGIRDVTERLAALAEQGRLRAEADRQKDEARLQRTQRMESLGQLAGGVAHDFNNLLAVILNYAEFIVEDGADTPFALDAEQILRAGRRGSELTHQLLAFARREVIRPKPLDVNRVVSEVHQMLTRSLGEHITLDLDLADRLPTVVADPGQLEQVLVNLAVNARDAMPSGGVLTIDTGVVHDQVRIRVSDTGTGMPREVMDKAFEPFFTTKPSGEGTGLGLATVYGIVAQAGGTVKLYSEPGLGTTITIMLPASDAEPHAGERARLPRPAARGETVLVAEDEPALREVTTRILRRGGYTVLAASDGVAALQVAADHHGPIDLLLTDVVMPGMLGRVLAERLLRDRPATRVLFMSGYAQPVLTSNGILDPGVHLLEKPFTGTDLLNAVGEQLAPL